MLLDQPIFELADFVSLFKNEKKLVLNFIFLRLLDGLLANTGIFL